MVRQTNLRSSAFLYVGFISLLLSVVACQGRQTNLEPEAQLQVEKVVERPVIYNGYEGFVPAHMYDYPEVLPIYRLPSERKVPGKVDQYDDKRAQNPEWYAITIPPSQVTQDVRGMVEWEPMQALILAASGSGYPEAWDRNVAEMAYASAHTAGVPTYIMFTNQQHRNAVQAKIDAFGPTADEKAMIHWVNLMTGSVWMIDYGPFALMNGQGDVALSDFRYYHERVEDDALPTRLATELFNINSFRMPTDFEGGNIQSDSMGTCYATQGVLWHNSATEAQLMQYFKDYVGCKQVVIVAPLQQEGTTHIDMFFKLIDDNRAILGSYTDTQDSQNKALLDNNQTILEAVELPDGTSVTVYRLPMPDNGRCGNDGNVGCATNADCPGDQQCTPRGVWRTFVNSTFVKGPLGAVNLWPVFDGQEELEAESLEVWSQLMPEWEHRTINATNIIQSGGAMHCISRTIPVGNMVPWVPDGTCADNTCVPQSSLGYAGACDISYGCSGPAWLCDSNNCDGDVDQCNGITFEGCCDGEFLTWCEDGSLKKQNCGQEGNCGWDVGSNFYNCDKSGAGPAEFPIDCPGECVPQCEGRNCGDDSCGASCGTCEEGLLCGDEGTCLTLEETCGDVPKEGCCDGPILNFCGDNGLESKTCASADLCGWNAIDGYYDCDASGEGPAEHPRKCPGSCGGCGAGQICKAGLCVPADGSCGNISETNLCGEKVLFGCDADGDLIQKICGECCGWVQDGGYYDCLTGADCCVPQCVDKVCGSDGCGGSCGACAEGIQCVAATGLCEDPTLVEDNATDDGTDGAGGNTGSSSGSGCNAGVPAPWSSTALILLLLSVLYLPRRRSISIENF